MGSRATRDSRRVSKTQPNFSINWRTMSSNLTSPSLQRLVYSRPFQRLAALIVAFLTTFAANAADDRPEGRSVVAAQASQPLVTSAEELVRLVAQRKLWPLKADAAEEQLRALGPWKREQPIAEALTLVAGRSGLVARSEISYAADAKKRWIFVARASLLPIPTWPTSTAR